MIEIFLKLLADAYEDEIAHLQLRVIRDTQAPRFEALKESHPAIYADFIKARTGPHEVLLKNRTRRIAAFKKIIENSQTKKIEELEKEVMNILFINE